MDTTRENVGSTITTSEKLDQLAAALSKAQAKIIGAVKDSANPFFKSRYADLSSVWDTVRGPLTENGLSLSQWPDTGPASTSCLTTMLLHLSGQWIRATIPLSFKDNTPQGIGSALTYFRRYSMAAVTGCPQIDDDAEAAMGRQSDALKHDPRPDVSQVSQERVAKMLAVFDGIAKKDIDEDAETLEIYDMHVELVKEQALYTAVADALQNSERISKADWKKAVARGKELAHKTI